MNNANQHEPVIISVTSNEQNATGDQHTTRDNTFQAKAQKAWAQLQPNVKKLWQHCQHGVAKIMTLSLIMMLWFMTMMLVTVSGAIALGATLWQSIKLSKSSRSTPADLTASAS